MTTPRASGTEPGSSFDELKTLLLTDEWARLNALEEQSHAVSGKVGTPVALTGSVADVLADALKQAEVKDHRRLAAAVAPLIVSAIRREITASRDMMVEALYPIAGRMVTTAVAHAFSDLAAQINGRIERALSVRLWKYRLKALVTGKTVSELILADSVGARLETLLLLDQQSGTVLARHPPAGSGGDKQDALIGGLITAISDLGRSAFNDTQAELRTLDFNGRKVLLRGSGAHVLVSVFAGMVPPAVESGADGVFLGAVDALVKRPDAPAEPILEETARQLEALGSGETTSPVQRKPWLLLGLVALLLAGLCAWWLHRAQARAGVDQALSAISTSEPFRPWPLNLATDHGARRITLSGVLPNAASADALRTALDQAAPGYALDSRLALIDTGQAASEANAVRQAAEQRMQAIAGDIRALAGSVEQSAAAAESARRSADERLAAITSDMRALGARIDQLSATAARQPDVAAISADLVALGRDVAAEKQADSALSAAVQAEIGALREQMNALAARVETARAAAPQTPAQKLRSLAEQSIILFSNDLDYDNAADAEAVIAALADALKAAPGARLMVNGYADPLGTEVVNRKLALGRAQKVAAAMQASGIDAGRLFVTAIPLSAGSTDRTGRGTIARRVDFRVVASPAATLP